MDTIRGMINMATDKSNDSDNGHSRSGPDTSSAYRSSDASGEPDVGTRSYSRETDVARDDWDDRRTSDANRDSSYLSRAGGGSGYSSGSSATVSGLGSERSLSGDSGRDNKSQYATMTGEDSSSSTMASSSSSYPSLGRRRNIKGHSRGSDEDDDGYGSRYASGNTGTNSGGDEIDDMDDGYSKRGVYGHLSRKGGSNQTYGSYASADNDNDYS